MESQIPRLQLHFSWPPRGCCFHEQSSPHTIHSPASVPFPYKAAGGVHLRASYPLNYILYYILIERLDRKMEPYEDPE